MSNYCAVADCTNNSKEGKAKGLVFHEFPKSRSDIRNKWIAQCRRKDKVNPTSSRMCSAHFSTDDYERDLRNELLGLPPRKKLKLDAIPTLFKSRPPAIPSTGERARAERSERKSRKVFVDAILATHSSGKR